VSSDVCNEVGGKSGICKGSFPYWFYKQTTQTCEPFVYGGCEAGSSPNKFKTKELCQQTCLKPIDDLLKPRNLGSATVEKPKVCLEEGGKPGICNGALTFWFFNQETNSCETFIYGGCEAGSSQNKFKTQELCEETCGAVIF